MLILTRKPQQQLVVGADVRITVLAVDGDQVTVGIHAPPAIPIARRAAPRKRPKAPNPAPPRGGRKSKP